MEKQALSLVFVLLLCLSPICGVVVAEEAEPNDSFENADPITTGRHSGLSISDGDDADYYKIEMDAGESVRITLTIKKVDGEIPESAPDIDVYNEQQERIQTQSRGQFSGNYDTTPAMETATMNLSIQSEANQTIYIRIDGRGGGRVTQSTAYELMVETDDDQFEPNGVFQNAAEITPGEYEGLQVVGGDDFDYYALAVEAGESVRITLTVHKQDGEIPKSAPDIDIYNEKQERIQSQPQGEFFENYDTTPAADVATMNLSIKSESSQILYIRIDGGGTPRVSQATQYGLTIESQDDQFEPNGVFSNAATIPAGKYNGLELAGGADADYYALSVNEGERANLTLTVYKQDGEIPKSAPDIDIYNEKQERIQSQPRGEFFENYDTTPAADVATMNLSVLSEESQTLYIRIDGGGSARISQTTTYDLDITLNSQSETQIPTSAMSPTPTSANTGTATASATVIETSLRTSTSTTDGTASEAYSQTTQTNGPGFGFASVSVSFVIVAIILRMQLYKK